MCKFIFASFTGICRLKITFYKYWQWANKNKDTKVNWMKANEAAFNICIKVIWYTGEIYEDMR